MKQDKDMNLAASDVDPVELPSNAFTQLGKDERVSSVMHPAREYSEVTPYSVGMGLLLAIVFSAAAAYLGLKVGQVLKPPYLSLS